MAENNTENNYTKIDFIIIIILSLLVSFIIGFNIIQLIDNKLSSVVINVPPGKCNLPPIYLNIDKDKKIYTYNAENINDELIYTDDIDKFENNSSNNTEFTDISILTNDDYDNLNNIPLISNSSNSNKIKLITENNSPLLKLEENNKNKINKIIHDNKINSNVNNNNFNGYNSYIDLKTDSYANITSIGKNLMTGYTSLPV